MRKAAQMWQLWIRLKASAREEKHQEMTIRRELIDELLKAYQTPQEILDGAFGAELDSGMCLISIGKRWPAI
jgi:hypothetical protein